MKRLINQGISIIPTITSKEQLADCIHATHQLKSSGSFRLTN
ncbi:MAG: hypothetical protein ACK5D5_13835 [Bacteroidota bacterium]